MSAKQERDGRKFGEQGRAVLRVLQEHGIGGYHFAKPGKHAEVRFAIGDDQLSYRFACTPRSAGGAAKTARRELSTLIRDTRMRGMAAAAASEKTGGRLINSHPKGEQMLQESMVLPALNGKATKGNSLYSDAQGQRARRAKAWFEDRLARARKEGIFTETIDLDPVVAEMLLSYNEGNRTLKVGKVADYVEDIRDGRWELNGETVKIALTGQLNDGQHRCEAVREAGKAIKTQITFGLPRETRLTVDQGVNRTTGDYLSMEGVGYANHSAAVARYLWQLHEYGTISTSMAQRPTRGQVRETYHANPKIGDSVRIVPIKGSAKVGGLSVLAFCHFVFAKKNARAADSFIKQLVEGAELKATDPIYVARQKLIFADRLRPAEKIEIIWRAWNAARSGRTLKSIPLTGKLPSLEH